MSEFAREVGLHYVSDQKPGISRRRHGKKSFRYFHPDGSAVKDAATLERIRGLVIPPGYENVWICADPRGHIQAVGYDVRGRKQYRYHPRWREVRDGNKFERMLQFGRALPKIRRHTRRQLAGSGLTRDKVLATVVQLLERTLIRVGNEEYARENKSFGLSTMRNRHVQVRGGEIRFTFRGKRGVHHDVRINDRRLARIVRNCQDLPGQDLFEYRDDDGQVHGITSTDVNEYLKAITGQEFSAKDFRTWAATVLAATALAQVGAAEKVNVGKKNVVAAVKAVSQLLGNTPAICRKSYIHPQILDCYCDGVVLDVAGKTGLAEPQLPAGYTGLDRNEKAVLNLLESRLRRRNRRAEASAVKTLARAA